MKKVIVTILSIAVFAGGFIIFYENRSVEQKIKTPTETGEQANNSEKWATRTDEQAAVTVTITPIDILSQSKEWKFNVVMDTHSIELDQDMTKVVVLIDDQGKEYKPLRWEGPVGSHHREGVLLFNSVVSTKSVEIKIKNIAGIPERSFKWNAE